MKKRLYVVSFNHNTKISEEDLKVMKTMVPNIRWKMYEDFELASWEMTSEHHGMTEEELIQDQKKRFEDYLKQSRKEFVIPYNDSALKTFDLYHFLSFGLNIPVTVESTYAVEINFTKEEWSKLQVEFNEPAKFV